VKRFLQVYPFQGLSPAQAHFYFAEQDVLRAYEYHANCYITKPVDLEQFLQVIRSVEDFWFTIVRLPK
jgi:response regulator RpfG family c-di-GMP phosphodiesterase